jgi:S-adenosylmethionine:tRNA ribosyltransferase-isomerase
VPVLKPAKNPEPKTQGSRAEVPNPRSAIRNPQFVIRLDDYDFDLPPELIAQVPALKREDSRLLVLDRSTGSIQFTRFDRIGDFLRPGDLLVVNDARVFPARLRGRRPTGGELEVFLLASLDDGSPRWRALLRPARSARRHRSIPLDAGGGAEARVIEEEESGRFVIELWRGGKVLDREGVLGLCEEAGEMPLPPYIQRVPGDPRRALDRERYQTVFARSMGAAAAPTAGLHFSPRLLAELATRGIETVAVTLMVGLGTFQPLREEALRAGRLHHEEAAIETEPGARILAARQEGRRVVAVGTTSVRTLESWALAGAPLPPAGEGGPAWKARTDLLIAPPFRFQMVDALVTNFHLPRSSLLLLVSAFAGRERILDAYRRAIEAGFRFYSYGDAMLIL